MSKKRKFNKKEKEALFLAADGRSDISGEYLRDNWHADHIEPWSLGGDTDVSNAQATNSRENLQKGNTHDRYKWQNRLMIEYQSAQRHDFMICALPGTGKTRAALKCAKAWKLDNHSSRIIVVVPTIPVREQWRYAASKFFDIELQTAEFNGTLKNDFDGIVITYSSVASSPLLFRRLCSMHACMVIFDEIHHAGDKSSWGTSILNAFENAKRRICLSGTPFKHDGQKIPFLRIDIDGKYHIDFPYDYPDALRDGVIREIGFHRYSGSVEIAIGEEEYEFHTDDRLDDDDSARRLRGLLKSGQYTRGLLKAAHEKLVTVRRAKPDAGALALCIDANHASAIAKLIQEITGEAPEIVVSDTDTATCSVDEFRKSNKKWIVAVRMVSEGVDIPRLMVLAYLTNTKTELFFRQAVGRIVRNEGTDFDTEAYCFMPDDPTLSDHAARIEEFQARVIKEENDTDDRKKREIGDIEQQFMSVLGSSDASFAGITSRGYHIDTSNSIQIRAIAEEEGIPEAKVAAIFQRAISTIMNIRTDVSDDKEPLEIRLRKLRKKCAAIANKLAYKRGIEPKDIHMEYMRLANVRQSEMTEEQLEGKKRWLLSELSK